jgi:chromosome segregation ATPase
MSAYGPKPGVSGPSEQEYPNLVRLEDRIGRVVELLESLRREKSRLEADLFRLKAENTKLYNSNKDLKFELEKRNRNREVLDKNREEIKHRIEALIEKLEGLEGSAPDARRRT